ncbi:tRNA modification GTPase MnmE [Serratia symbiotica]|nr:tRNA modification GTPase MnmE [Serratia symbiotica]
MSITDTIVAQATPIGRGGISILRISGTETKKLALILLGKLPKPRYANYLSFFDINGKILDKGIALWFPAPNSFTGEDVLELQGHGGLVIVNLLLKCILSQSNVRIAHPGEFCKRAFINNKLDLTQAEAISDLIDAHSEQAAKSAINSLQGNFSTLINKLVKKLINLRIDIESEIDFPNEKTNFLFIKKIAMNYNSILINLDKIYYEANCSSILREEKKIVIIGKPNSGKSTIFNLLIGYNTAIVTDIPGTTRDILREYINIDGIPLCIIDTAGLRKSNNKIEKIGINYALNEIKKANIILLVIDSTTTIFTDSTKMLLTLKKYISKDLSIIIIRNKIDITHETSKIVKLNNYPLIYLSAYTGEGIDLLKNYLKKNINLNNNTENNFLARQRHLEALKKAKNYLIKGKNYIQNIYTYDLLAEELRLVQQELNKITGNFTSDNLLERIFSTFCIGK